MRIRREAFISARYYVIATVCMLLSTSVWPSFSEANNLLTPAQRVMFLGDSITNNGGYIVALEAQLQSLADPPELINLGLSSETCSGLSEPAHPFPRPNVHERLQRALDKVKPDLVVACYGMNDAIYHPFDEVRFKKFQNGVRQLIAKCRATGAEVILLTPPPFDPLPLRNKGKLRPATAKEFDWRTPYEKYDEVIEKYANWVLSQRDQVDEVIDVFHPISTYVEAKRADDPDFALSEDGVHINEEGHQALASAILEHYQTAPKEIDPKLFELLRKRQQIMHAAWLSHVGHKRPGVKPGLPMEQAKAKAKQLSAQMQ